MADDIYTKANQLVVEASFDEIVWNHVHQGVTNNSAPTLASDGDSLKGSSNVLIVSDTAPGGGAATVWDIIPWFYFEDADGPGWVPFPDASLVGLTTRTPIVARVGKQFSKIYLEIVNSDGNNNVWFGRSIT